MLRVVHEIPLHSPICPCGLARTAWHCPKFGAGGAAFCALGYAAEAARRTRAAASSSETRPWATSNSRIEVVCGARLG